MTDWLKSEAEILKRIASNKTSLSNTIGFALDSAFPHPERPYAQDVYVGINIPREKLQLEPKLRPGDIDYLIVPFAGDQILFDRAMAIEAKIVRPTMSNPNRNANSMGRTQALGLLRDGFPFVGLVHISVPEPLPLQMHWEIPYISGKLGANGELLMTGEHLDFDPFPLMSAQRQEGRVLALGLPEQVGYRVIAMNLSKDKEGFSGNTLGEERPGLRNPHTSDTLITSIRALFSTEPHLFQCVHWYGDIAT